MPAVVLVAGAEVVIFALFITLFVYNKIVSYTSYKCSYISAKLVLRYFQVFTVVCP